MGLSIGFDEIKEKAALSARQALRGGILLFLGRHGRDVVGVGGTDKELILEMAKVLQPNADWAAVVIKEMPVLSFQRQARLLRINLKNVLTLCLNRHETWPNTWANWLAVRCLWSSTALSVFLNHVDVRELRTKEKAWEEGEYRGPDGMHTSSRGLPHGEEG